MGRFTQEVVPKSLVPAAELSALENAMRAEQKLQLLALWKQARNPS